VRFKSLDFFDEFKSRLKSVI